MKIIQTNLPTEHTNLNKCAIIQQSNYHALGEIVLTSFADFGKTKDADILQQLKGNPYCVAVFFVYPKNKPNEATNS